MSSLVQSLATIHQDFPFTIPGATYRRSLKQFTNVIDNILVSDIEVAFNGTPTHGSLCNFSNPSNFDLPLEEDFNDIVVWSDLYTFDWHQQSIGRNNSGEFVVTASYPEGGGYLFLTDANRVIKRVLYLNEQAPYPNIYLNIISELDHPAGLQVAADILVFSWLKMDQDEIGSIILFYDFSSVETIRRLDHLTIYRSGQSIDCVGMCPIIENGLYSGWLLMLLDGKNFIFYKSTAPDLRDNTTRFEHISGPVILSDDAREYQTVNLYTDCTGMLWFIGLETTKSESWSDWADLVELGNISDPLHFNRKAIGHFYTSCSHALHYGPHFDWGAGSYYDRSHNTFKIYATPLHNLSFDLFST